MFRKSIKAHRAAERIVIMNLTKNQITAKGNNKIKFEVIHGHFTTNHSHVNRYIDMNDIKNNYKSAKETAKQLAGEIYSSVPVDAIICIESTRLVGAFLAEELSEHARGLSAGNDIYCITPENVNNQIILRDNLQQAVRDKHVLLLVSSVSSGKSVQQAANCINYYGGTLTGVCAIFSAVPEVHGIKINSVFHADDIPDYESYNPAKCPMCSAGRKIDAIVNSFGYTQTH